MIESEIVRIEQAEIAKAKKIEEAKKVEAEKVAKAKRIEEGYMDFSGTAEEVPSRTAINDFGKDEYDSFYIGTVQTFTSTKAPDGTLTVKLTMNMEGRQGQYGDFIRILTFPPNELKSSIFEIQLTDTPHDNNKTDYEPLQYEIINSTTIWNRYNNTHIKFSTPFTKP